MDETTFVPFKGHADAILTLTYSPDGAFLATGSHDSTIRVWEAATGRQVGDALEGHTSWVSAICYSPNGKHLVSGSDDRSLRIWDAHTYQTIVGPLEGHADFVTAVKYSPDGAFIASGCEDCCLKLWNAHVVGECIATFEHPRYVRSVSFSPSGKHVATACDDSCIRIFSVDGLELQRKLSGHRGCIRSIQYSPDGSIIASASDDYTIRLWNVQSGELVHYPLRGHKYRVADISLSPDGQQLISCSDDESIRIWNVASGACVLGPLYSDGERLKSLCCSPDGRKFATCSNGSVRVWSIHDGKQVLPQTISKSSDDVAGRYKVKVYDTVRAVTWFSGKQHFASAGRDRAIRIWDLTGQEVAYPRVWHDNTVNGIDISRQENLLASASADGLIYIWDLGHENTVPECLSGHVGSVRAVKFTPDDARLASGGSDGTIRIWDVHSGTCLHDIGTHSDAVRTLSISSDGSRLASGSDDETVRIWDLGSYEAVGKPLKHNGKVWSVCFAPDGSQVLSGSSDRMVRVFNISSGEQVFVFKHERAVNCVQFSPSGSKFLSASNDHRVCVREADSGNLLQTLQHDSDVEAAAFSPDGTRVVSGTLRGDLRLWDVKSGRLLLPKRLVNGGAGADDDVSNPDNQGEKDAKTQVRRSRAPMGLDSDTDSFLERSAILHRRNIFIGANIDEIILSEAEDSGTRNFAFNFRQAFSRLRGNMRRHRNEVNDNNSLLQNNVQDVTRHDRLNGAMNAFRQFWARTTSKRGGNTSIEQDHERGREAYRTHGSHRPSRVLDTIYPAYGNARIMAAGERPGRTPGGDTVAADRDVSPSGSDSDSSEESYPLITELLCFCNWSLIFARRQTEPRSTRMQRRSAPANGRTDPAEPESSASRYQVGDVLSV